VCACVRVCMRACVCQCVRHTGEIIYAKRLNWSGCYLGCRLLCAQRTL